jgi:macrolide-specific efflux system membrane fusion protein
VGQNAPTTSSSTVGSVSGLFVLTDVTALQVTASFSEADAAKLVVGQPTTYTFSALSNVTASGKLLSVDLLPTVSSGATSYKATFTIDGKVSGLKPGMTVTATVLTGAGYNVLQVASAAVTTRGTGSFVNVITTKNGADVITRTPVVIGLKGDSADQIISGVKNGTKVVLRSTTASTVGSNGFPVTTGGLGGAAVGGGGGGGRGAGGFGG